jgi:hypothetical protein
MKTSQQDENKAGNESTGYSVTADAVDTAEIRILKERGFYGVTLPVELRVKGGEAGYPENYTTPFFTANRTYMIVSVIARWEVKCDVACTLQIMKVPNGTAPASGTALLATAFNLTGTANTNNIGTLVTTAGVNQIVAGESLSGLTTGGFTSLAGVSVSVLLKAI